MVGGGVLLGRVHIYRTHELTRFIHKIVNQSAIYFLRTLGNTHDGALFHVALFHAVDTWGSVGIA